MRKFIELSVDTLANFPVKEKKGMLPVEPDLVFDFYLFPKIYIIDDMVGSLSRYLTHNVELSDGAVELKKDDLRSNFTHVYIISDYDTAVDDISDDIHIFRNKDNSALFLSEEFVSALNNLKTDYILYRWHQ